MAYRRINFIKSRTLAIKQFIINGAHWNTSTIRTRRYVTPKPAGFTAPQVVVLSKIDRIITATLVNARPAWFGDTRRRLWHTQDLDIGLDFRGRLCWYCLGLYRDVAFQIDHIIPQSGRKKHTRQSYNKAENLIAVCRTCNTSKGKKKLTRSLLNECIKKRQTSYFPLPGVENITDLIGISKNQDAETVKKIV